MSIKLKVNKQNFVHRNVCSHSQFDWSFYLNNCNRFLTFLQSKKLNIECCKYTKTNIQKQIYKKSCFSNVIFESKKNKMQFSVFMFRIVIKVLCKTKKNK